MKNASGYNSFDELFRDKYSKLLRLAYRSTGNYHDSEDLVDEAFVIYIQKVSSVSIENPEAYLVGILSKLICNYKRKQLRDIGLLEKLTAELQDETATERLEDLLPAELLQWEKEILVLRFERQLSYAEIAKVLQIKEASCRSRLLRAKAHYAELISKKCE